MLIAARSQMTQDGTITRRTNTFSLLVLMLMFVALKPVLVFM